MARKVKCPVCGKMNNKEDTTSRSGKYYCPECLEAKKAKKGDMDMLFDYICEVYKIDKPTGRMFAQLKDYRDNYKFTDQGMYLTLKYCVEILGMNFEMDAEGRLGIGIIPHKYEETKRHYSKIMEIEDSISDIEEIKPPNIRKIKITPVVIKPLKNRAKIEEDIDWGEDDEE